MPAEKLERRGNCVPVFFDIDVSSDILCLLSERVATTGCCCYLLVTGSRETKAVITLSTDSRTRKSRSFQLLNGEGVVQT